MKVDKVGVYPYNAEFDPILRHMSLLDSGFHIKALISPSGWGLVGKLIVSGIKGDEWIVVSEFKKVISDIDTVFIPSFNVTESIESLLVNEVKVITPKIKKVICSAKLSEKNAEDLKKSCENEGCTFINLNLPKSPQEYGLVHPMEEYPPLESIDVPIVVIAGLWEDTDKFEVSLVLRNKFIQSDYTVTQVGSRNCCGLLGIHSFPNFMLGDSETAVSKIVHFNRLILKLVRAEKPDVVVITIPGAIKNMSNKHTRGFGLLPYIVFQALIVDFFLFCTVYEDGSTQFLQEMSTMCRYKFDCPVDCYHMSNILFNLNESKSLKRTVIDRVERDDVSRVLKTEFDDSPIPIINLMEHSAQDKLFSMIINKLSGDDFPIVF